MSKRTSTNHLSHLRGKIEAIRTLKRERDTGWTNLVNALGEVAKAQDEIDKVAREAEAEVEERWANFAKLFHVLAGIYIRHREELQANLDGLRREGEVLDRKIDAQAITVRGETSDYRALQREFQVATETKAEAQALVDDEDMWAELAQAVSAEEIIALCEEAQGELDDAKAKLSVLAQRFSVLNADRKKAELSGAAKELRRLKGQRRQVERGVDTLTHTIRLARMPNPPRSEVPPKVVYRHSAPDTQVEEAFSSDQVVLEETIEHLSKKERRRQRVAEVDSRRHGNGPGQEYRERESKPKPKTEKKGKGKGKDKVKTKSRNKSR
ncbi:hypothetical protein CMI37_07230 [Candidatus Pacearchaeota archaeon]|nr:hypothetical protein [Candidatus Pacearchaeota archaeon]